MKIMKQRDNKKSRKEQHEEELLVEQDKLIEELTEVKVMRKVKKLNMKQKNKVEC